MIEGHQADEYALYFEDQVYPRYAITYKVVMRDGNGFEIDYKGNYTHHNINIVDLIDKLRIATTN